VFSFLVTSDYAYAILILKPLRLDNYQLKPTGQPMVTVTDKQTERSQGTGGRFCEGCPRCRDDDAGFCKQQHLQYNGLHPVCRVCGHCAL